jgi:hypothetical protein
VPRNYYYAKEVIKMTWLLMQDTATFIVLMAIYFVACGLVFLAGWAFSSWMANRAYRARHNRIQLRRATRAPWGFPEGVNIKR